MPTVAIRKSLAYRKGFGRTKHQRLIRAYGLIGCYDHTPHPVVMDMMAELELSILTTDQRVWETLDKARRIVARRGLSAILDA